MVKFIVMWDQTIANRGSSKVSSYVGPNNSREVAVKFIVMWDETIAKRGSSKVYCHVGPNNSQKR